MQADVTHFSMIGFPMDGTNAGVNALVSKQISRCAPKPISEADIACAVHDNSGAEIWISLHKRPDGKTEFVTLNPAFAGEGRVKLHIDGDNSDPEWTPFEVSRAARFSGEATPIIFDLADPTQAAGTGPGTDVTVAISAFSYQPSLYEDATAYYAAQKKAGSKVLMGAESFIPSGMFFAKAGGAMPDDAKRPRAHADLAGTVVKAKLLTNAAGGAPFWSVLTKTYGGATVDIVIDPASIKVEPKPGNIITGRFWLSGRIVPAS